MGEKNNILSSNIDVEELNLLSTAFKLYDISKSHSNIYRKRDNSICKNLILQYYRLIKPDYNTMVTKFKKKYVRNEALVEKNDTLEERLGISIVYDYIQNFDINTDFNIFVETLKIHSMLYKPLDDKNKSDETEKLKSAKKLLEESKIEKNLEKYRMAKEMMKSCESANFGGKLRDSNVLMRDFNVDVPDYKDALLIMNSYLKDDKRKEYNKALTSYSLLEYIEYAVRETTFLIGVQPFTDGNKRTFRALLNLMFKKRNIPPVYIVKKERKAYHDALEKAIVNNNYEDITTFYYYKICDSIFELDFEPYLEFLEARESKKLS